MMPRIVAFIFGSVVGSFLNVCIHRMPNGESVVWPRSHCPICKKRIPGYDNIPFLSYIMLGGKCRFCKQKISLRYPLVELLTALIFVVLYGRYGVSYNLFVYIALISGLIIATFVDIKHRIIPDEVSIGGMILGFILCSVRGFSLTPFSFNARPMAGSFLGIIVGGGIIWLTGFLFDQVYFKLLKRPPIQGETESMGGGDVKLLAMIGAFLGWQKALLTFFIAPFAAVIYAAFAFIFKKSHLIPYLPYLSVGTVVVFLWGDRILKLIF